MPFVRLPLGTGLLLLVLLLGTGLLLLVLLLGAGLLLLVLLLGAGLLLRCAAGVVRLARLALGAGLLLVLLLAICVGLSRVTGGVIRRLRRSRLLGWDVSRRGGVAQKGAVGHATGYARYEPARAARGIALFDGDVVGLIQLAA